VSFEFAGRAIELSESDKTEKQKEQFRHCSPRSRHYRFCDEQRLERWITGLEIGRETVGRSLVNRLRTIFDAPMRSTDGGG
jgi:hypothetical protein